MICPNCGEKLSFGIEFLVGGSSCYVVSVVDIERDGEVVGSKVVVELEEIDLSHHPEELSLYCHNCDESWVPEGEIKLEYR